MSNSFWKEIYLKIEGAAFFVAQRWRIFLLSLVVQFVLTSLLHLGIKAPKQLNFLSVQQMTIGTKVLVSPQPEQPNSWSIILQKLQNIRPDFSLKKEGSLLPSAFAASLYDGAAAYLVVDLDSGHILAGKNESKRLPVASLTKIMTAVVALDLAAPEEKFLVSEKAAAVAPTKIGVAPGEKINLEELLPAVMMTSANDAAEVIKGGIDRKYGTKDGESLFIRAMNAKADFLGLKNTHFSNPQGFDSQKNYSTASDLALLADYALRSYPLIADIVQTDYQLLPPSQGHKQFELYNWNGLLGVYPGVYGVKIGNTGKAGYTTVVTAEREGKKILVVLLGAPGVLERDLWASQLLDLGFEKLGLFWVGVTEGDLQNKYSTWRY